MCECVCVCVCVCVNVCVNVCVSECVNVLFFVVFNLNFGLVVWCPRHMVSASDPGFDFFHKEMVGPWQSRWVALSAHVNRIAVDHKVATFHFHIARETSMNAVVLQQVCQGLNIGQVVDGTHFDTLLGKELSEGQSADAAESVNRNFGHDLYDVLKFKCSGFGRREALRRGPYSFC